MKERAVLAFTVLVALTVAAHFAFVGYLLIGGFLAWRRPKTIPASVAAVEIDRRACWAAAPDLRGFADVLRFARRQAG
jgi:hypothetical protein